MSTATREPSTNGPAAKARPRATTEGDEPKMVTLVIQPPNMLTARLRLVGTAPLVQARFAQKAREQMMTKMAQGSTAKKGGKRAARDFDEDFRQSMHVSSEGWVGLPAAAIRNACIDVCRMVDFKMTRAKMSIFVLADGHDKEDGTPLIRIIADEPSRVEIPVRNATGVADIRVRPQWREWAIEPVIRYDADQFTLQDIVNLVARAGMQVGIGEGRPYGRSANGMGFGLFAIETTT